MTLIVSVVLGAFVASLALTALVRRYALRRGVLDRPNARSSHTAPTPRGGGLAIVASVAGALVVLVITHAVELRTASVIGVGMLIIAAIGWLDDHASVSALTRLLVHMTVAFATVVAIGGLTDLRIGSGVVRLGVAGSIVAAVAVVWSINLFNFMDGIDGIAGSEATLVFAAMAVLLFVQGDVSLGAVSAVIAAATAGFLWWNWPPARIFLGDVGSGALGFAIAALALIAERRGSVPVLAVLIVYGAFVADATVTLVRRLLRGQPPAEAHRDHAYQRLSRAWQGHRPVTVATILTTLALVAIAAVGTLRPALLPASATLAALLLTVLLYAVERRAPLARVGAEGRGRAP